MEQPMTPQEKAFLEAKKLKNEVDEKKAGEAKALAEVKNSLETVRKNKALQEMYEKDAELGSENAGGQSPQLKIHATGKSTSNVLANGEDPNDGYFFYQPTGEQFKEVECHILSISRGYRVESLNEEKKARGETDYNQLMGGVIVNGGKPRPFIMYMAGSRLQKMWDFAADAAKYKRAKPFAIPLFALRVKLTSEKKIAEYEPGKKTPVWLVNFEIMKDENNEPVVIGDEKAYSYLKSQVDSVKEMFNVIIKAKEINKVEVTEPDEDIAQPVPTIKVNHETGEAVNPEDIPF